MDAVTSWIHGLIHGHQQPLWGVAILMVMVLLVLYALLLLSFGSWQTNNAEEDQAAWERFERAKALLRQRNNHHNQRYNPDWPNPRGSHSSNNNNNNNQPQKTYPEHDASSLSSKADLFNSNKNQHLSAKAIRAKSQGDLQQLSNQEIEQLFDNVRPKDTTQKMTKSNKEVLYPILKEWASRLDRDLVDNRPGGTRWIRPYLLPPLPQKGGGQQEQRELQATPNHRHDKEPGGFFKMRRGHDFRKAAKWIQEWEALKNQEGRQQQQQRSRLEPPVDYRNRDLYSYPPLMDSPPKEGGYPKTTTLGELIRNWPQNEDFQGDTIHEALLHFNFSNPTERAMAQRFRDARLPFKIYDIPDIDHVTKLWTDDYVHQQFDEGSSLFGGTKRADGLCQESPNHFFAFYVPPLWQTTTMGLPPVRNNDFTYQEWSEHARYADAKPLAHDQPHFYWQAGAERTERYEPPHKQGFISRDLNTTLGASENNFFVFNIDEQKGIQCRFGERGVTAATHYDAGQNMIAMLKGAKRYILSPPKACPQLGVFSARHSPIFRHSLLNFAHLAYLENDQEDNNNNNNKSNPSSPPHTDEAGNPMSDEERAWLTRAAEAPALETVLKEGEVMFLPSFWFHYIVSVQKSAQCNVRSGVDEVGTPEFGSVDQINSCAADTAQQSPY